LFLLVATVNAGLATEGQLANIAYSVCSMESWRDSSSYLKTWLILLWLQYPILARLWQLLQACLKTWLMLLRLQ
jgi:hypothetical protein